jgi:hypothetical protein
METTNPNKTTENISRVKHWLITPENAREMSLKANEAKRLKREAQLADPSYVPPPKVKPIEPDEPESFLKTQRDMLRTRMSRVSDMIAKEKDPAKLDRLCSAYSKLAEEERKADGRPLPGAFRPVERRAKSSSIEPVMPLE